ncbi:type II toxin-antitoxin system Phd/YefM family antitoxin [Rhodococcus sp. OK302]|uniref:type II toxin-antitoxin system Phd/YefM family antitoxin n=1 Tax=Rhodococcus sp. OK302 TaxID=1882769 RepID=UPI000B93F1CF|nr:type II toxin-antitoxin system Phd/YefM family antitoxin [Rhodococcus sp. OK302]OYD67372.1 prevent-host-death family protein [Rhodococcus sp. OK302]
MTTLSVASARANFSRLVEEAEHTHERFEITSNGRRAAELLGADDYDALTETIAVLSDAHLMREHQDGADEIAAGHTVDGKDLAALRRDAYRT